jgi:hypothetical protein
MSLLLPMLGVRSFVRSFLRISSSVGFRVPWVVVFW